MVVHYKKGNEDMQISGVSWLDVFMLTSGSNTAVFMKDGQEIEIPLEDLMSITEEEKNSGNLYTYQRNDKSNIYNGKYVNIVVVDRNNK